MYDCTWSSSSCILVLAVLTEVNINPSGKGLCTISPSGGVLLSPDFPYDYGPYRDLIYTVVVPNSKRISIIFDIFVVETNKDFVYVSLNMKFDFASIGFFLTVNIVSFCLPDI